ncbi:MAG: hypothetical protein FWG97_01560 [Deltaproteobacteria bacterium]|nr:hypothetical protein [Deltaproteobacteria bacterium]
MPVNICPFCLTDVSALNKTTQSRGGGAASPPAPLPNGSTSAQPSQEARQGGGEAQVPVPDSTIRPAVPAPQAEGRTTPMPTPRPERRVFVAQPVQPISPRPATTEPSDSPRSATTESPDSPKPLPKLRCPGCGKLVTLPATECIFCGTDFRTGFTPEPEVKNLRLKKAWKVSRYILLILIPGLFLFGPEVITQRARTVCYNVLKLGICAPDQGQDFLANTRAQLLAMVRNGFAAWQDDKKTRMASGQPKVRKNFSESQVRLDYFLETLARLDENSPGSPLPPDQDIFASFIGEWDVVWMEKQGDSEERLAEGEWIFAQLAGGLALQDILAVPYFGQASEADGPAPLRLITLRQFNHRRAVWEGVRLLPEGMSPVLFQTGKSGGLEELNMGGAGETTLRRFVDVTPDSFRLLVSVSPSGKAESYRPIGELWAKKRVIALP